MIAHSALRCPVGVRAPPSKESATGSPDTETQGRKFFCGVSNLRGTCDRPERAEAQPRVRIEVQGLCLDLPGSPLCLELCLAFNEKKQISCLNVN